MMQNVESYLTSSEVKSRNRWLTYIFILAGFYIAMYGIQVIRFFMGQQPGYEILEGFAGCLWGISWCYLSYHFCFKKQTTPLLTISLISTGLGLLGCICTTVFFSIKTLDLSFILGTIFFCGLILIPVWIIFLLNYRLRKINKILRCHQKYPQESNDLIQAFRGALDINSLGALFKSALVKTPHLKYLIHREWNLKKLELKTSSKDL